MKSDKKKIGFLFLCKKPINNKASSSKMVVCPTARTSSSLLPSDFIISQCIKKSSAGCCYISGFMI